MTRALAPRFWAAHALAMVLVAAAGWLGAWQFHGWQERRAAEARDLTLAQPVPLNRVLGPDDPFPGDAVGRPVVLAGTWVPDGTVYVTGHPRGGRDGVWAVTPLAIGGADDPALLVVRGWAPDPTRAPAPPTGTAELVAWLQPPEGTAGLVDDDPSDDLLPELRIADAIQHVDQDLYGGYGVVADRAAPGDWPVGEDAVNPGTEGLSPVSPDQLPEVGQFTALRNLFYALEWWVFGAFALFVWWQWLRDRLRAERGAGTASDEPSPGDPDPGTPLGGPAPGEPAPGAAPVSDDHRSRTP